MEQVCVRKMVERRVGRCQGVKSADAVEVDDGDRPDVSCVLYYLDAFADIEVDGIQKGLSGLLLSSCNCFEAKMRVFKKKHVAIISLGIILQLFCMVAPPKAAVIHQQGATHPLEISFFSLFDNSSDFCRSNCAL